MAYAKVLPVEPQFEFALWNLHNKGQPYRIDSENLGKKGLAGADIKILGAWKIQDSAPDVLVAVMDGDFDLNHPDLIDSYATEQAYGCLKDRSEISPPPSDSILHHGTMVSGIIAA